MQKFRIKLFLFAPLWATQRGTRVVGLLLAFLLLAPFSGMAQFPLRMGKGELKLMQTLSYISNYYVDTVDMDPLVEKAIVSVLEQLDPHSYYIDQEDATNVTSELEGHFDGIGVEFTIIRDTLQVVSAIPSGPAEKNGVRAGDRIIAVDGENIAGVGVTNARVFKLLRGKKGTRVRIRNVRGRDTLDFTLVRDAIPLHSVDVVYMLRPTIGYIRLNRFAMNSNEEFEAALRDLHKAGAKSYVLDLRGNGGGVMETSVRLAAHFLQPGNQIVYAQGRSVPKQEYFAPRGAGKYADVPLVVLVDEYSASASEILSGALQDWDRAVIVGRRTFGKGLVQNQIPLADGSLIRITVARYYTPSGRMIQTPYEMGHKEEYVESFRARYEGGELFAADSMHLADTLRFRTLRTGRPVYGGGGIVPDVFVPIDTVRGSAYVNRLDRKGLINQWVTDYMEAERGRLKARYKSFEAFDRDFKMTSAMRDALVALGRQEGVEPQDSVLTERDEYMLAWRVKAFVARSLFSFTELVRVVNSESHEVQRAVEILERWDALGVPLLEGGESL